MADPKPTGEPGGESVVSAEAEKLVRSWAYVDCITDEHDGGDLFTTLVSLISSALEAARREEDTLPAKVLDLCRERGWSLHWTHRGAYLHLEASELIEAVRGKGGSVLGEAADVLLVLMSITEYAGVPWRKVRERAAIKLAEVRGRPPGYPGEEHDPFLARPTPKAPEGAPEYRALTEAREREEKNIFVPTGQVGIRCVCGHLKSEHRYILGCTVLDCACGPGCIHAGFVDAVAAPEGGEPGEENT